MAKKDPPVGELDEKEEDEEPQVDILEQNNTEQNLPEPETPEEHKIKMRKREEYNGNPEKRETENKIMEEWLEFEKVYKHEKKRENGLDSSPYCTDSIKRRFSEMNEIVQKDVIATPQIFNGYFLQPDGIKFFQLRLFVLTEFKV